MRQGSIRGWLLAICLVLVAGVVVAIDHERPREGGSALKSRAVALVRADLPLRDLPEPAPQRLRLVSDPRFLAELYDKVFDIWSVPVAQARWDALRRELLARAREPRMEMLSGISVKSPMWRRLSVTGDDAHGVFVANTSHTSARTGQVVDEGRVEYTVGLHRDPDRVWRLSALTPQSLDGEG